VQVLQPVAPHDDLVAVGQRTPLDALAVDEDAVERPVVQDPDAVGLAHDQRVPARHRRVVEAHVGGQAAPDPRPLLAQGEDPHAAAVLVGQVLARLRDLLARGGDHRVALLGRRRLTGAAVEPPSREQRRAHEARAVASRTGWKLVRCGQRHHVAALLTPEGPCSREGPRRQGLHMTTPS
jgi:hypothetical protein